MCGQENITIRLTDAAVKGRGLFPLGLAHPGDLVNGTAQLRRTNAGADLKLVCTGRQDLGHIGKAGTGAAAITTLDLEVELDTKTGPASYVCEATLANVNVGTELTFAPPSP